MAARKATVFFLLLLAALASLVFLLKIKDEMVDFEVGYVAAKRLRGAETLYRVSDGHYQFKYMPFSASLYLPLSFLPITLAKACWYGMAICCSILIFWLSLNLVRSDSEKRLLLALLPPLILARYFLREIQLGQINTLITLLLLLMVWFLGRRNSSLYQGMAGFFWGLATALKPYAVIFFPYLVIRKKWLSLAIGLIILISALLLPSFFFGPRGNFTVLREWKTSLAASTPSLLSSQDNVSLLGFLVKWTGRQDLSFTLYLIILALLSLMTLWLFLKAGKASETAPPILLDSFLLLAYIPLLSPLGWDYTFLSFAPAVVLILNHVNKYRVFWRGILILDWALIALTLYDLMGRRLYASFMHSSVITVNFLILIGFLFYLRTRGHA